MSRSKHIDAICCVIMALALLVTVLFMAGEKLGLRVMSKSPGYETRLFDTSRVHSVDIVMDAADWEAFLADAMQEEYVAATVVIDGEAHKNVALRAKGNTSLSNVQSYGNDRYSLKIEFDRYEPGNSYYGLDKLVLNNCIQDNTYMKDYLTYRLMAAMGVSAPLTSYAWITVNGADWGLYLALEGVEESFLARNYGSDYGELYKPDSMSMGGGRGNGRDFDMDAVMDMPRPDGMGSDGKPGMPGGFGNMGSDGRPDMPGGMGPGGMGGPGNMGSDGRPDMPGGMGPGGMGGPGNMGSDGRPDMPGGMDPGNMGGPGGGMGGDDVSLVYTDDEYESYSNIFESAKTDITNADRDRLIASLKKLNAGEDIAEVVDVEAVLKYFVVHNFVDNFDSYTGSMIHNYYLYEKDGQLSMIPWDYNLAFGAFANMGGESDATAMVNYPIDTPVSGGSMASRPLLNALLRDETYLAEYHAYFAEFMESCFTSGMADALIADTAALIGPYVQKDPTAFCTYAEFESGVATLREFCALRAQSVQGQLEGRIPSTTEGQSADPSALVDASHIELDDMGSFSAGGMGGGMGREGGPFSPPS